MLTSKFSFIVCVLFLLFINTGQILAESSSGLWTTGASAPTERTEVAAAAVEGKVYVIGGFSSELSVRNALNLAISRAVEVYDPISNTWSLATPLPEGRHHAGVAVLNGMLYVIGGFTQSFLSVWHAVPTVYQYNPTTGLWSERAPMPTARGALGVAVYQDKLYAVGGYDGESNPDVVEVFDPQTNTWSSAAPLPTPRDHLAITTVGSRIYAIGGRSNLDYGQNQNTVEAYNPETNQWQSRASLPTARSGVAVGVIGDRIYVLGGESEEGTFATNEMYIPNTDHWHVMTPMPTARHGSGAAVVDGRLYIMNGGPTPGGSFSSVNEIFTPPVLLH